MSKGSTYPSEARWLTDERTGARIRQVTSHPSIHDHPSHARAAWARLIRKVYVANVRNLPSL